MKKDIILFAIKVAIVVMLITAALWFLGNNVTLDLNTSIHHPGPFKW